MSDVINGVLVTVECFNCKGRGRIPGGQIQYGEVVSCPVCSGKGWTSKRLPLEDVIKILKKPEDA
jgi:DnaJ-class molecular chaperone